MKRSVPFTLSDLKAATAFFLALLATATLTARDDFQSWQDYNFKWYDGERFDLSFNGHLRLTDDFSRLSHWRLGQNISTDLAPWLGGALAYRYGEGKRASGSWNHYQRVEFELTPRWKHGDIRMAFRNRLEVIWNEGGNRTERTRHRLQASFPIEALPAARNAFLNVEAFYDLDRNRLMEIRTTPIGLNFKLNDQASLSLYYMLRSQRGNSWTHSHLLGTALSYAL